MSLDEYYRRLELSSTASPAEIKRAYRRLRAKYHPDRNKGREATVEPAFKRVQEAFEILIGERQAPIANAAAAPTHGREKETERERGRENEAPRHDHRSRPPLRGANCTAELFVPLDAAIHGGDVEVSYMVKGPCPYCHGHASHRCTTCRGTRIAAYRKRETVTLSAGAWDGQRIVVEGAGHPGTGGGASGDAIFSVAIVCSSAFRRDGLNLACDIEVDFITAILGGRIEVQVLGRPMPVTIQPDSQPGSTVRLKGHGLSDCNGSKGDLALRLALAMPAAAAHLTGDERQRLREMFAAAQHRAMQALSAD